MKIIKNKLVVVFLIAILPCSILFECHSYHSLVKNDSENSILGISPKLLSILDTIRLDDYYSSGELKELQILEVSIVDFGETSCYLWIVPSFIYNPERVIGSFKLNNRIVVIYPPIGNCEYNLIQEEKLKIQTSLDTLKTYKDFRGDLDPHGFAYKIHSNDSLELVQRSFSLWKE